VGTGYRRPQARVGHYFKWVGQSPEWVGHGLPGLGLEPPLNRPRTLRQRTQQQHRLGLCGDGLRVCGGVWPSYNRRRRRPTLLSASAASEHENSQRPLKFTGLYVFMLGSAKLGSLDFCEKSIRRHYSAAVSPITMKLWRLMQNIIPIMKIWSKSKSEIEFDMTDVCFCKSEIVLSQPWIELSRRNLV